MRILLSLAILLLALSSCNLQKRCAALYPPTVDTLWQRYDSVEIREKISIREVPFYVMGDTVVIQDTIPCKETFKGVAKGRYIDAEVSLKNGVLHVICKTDSLKKQIALLSDTLRWERSRSSNQQFIRTTKVITTRVPDPYVPNWVWLVVAANVFLLAWKLYPLWGGPTGWLSGVLKFFKR